MSSFADLIQDQAALQKLQGMRTLAEAPSYPSVQKILESRTADQRNQIGVLLSHDASDWVADLLKQRKFFVIDIKKTSHHDQFIGLKVLAKKHGLILVDGTFDMAALVGISGNKHMSFFPTLDEVLGIRQPNKNQNKVLLDNNIPPAIFRRLNATGNLFVIDIKNTKHWRDLDEEIVHLANQHEFIIITQDLGFIEPEEHNLSQMRGVVIFPPDYDEAGINKHRQFLQTTAIDDFLQVALPAISDWKATSLVYALDGIVTLSQPPFKTDEDGVNRPRSVKAQYWPSPALA